MTKNGKSVCFDWCGALQSGETECGVSFISFVAVSGFCSYLLISVRGVTLRCSLWLLLVVRLSSWVLSHFREYALRYVLSFSSVLWLVRV